VTLSKKCGRVLKCQDHGLAVFLLWLPTVLQLLRVRNCGCCYIDESDRSAANFTVESDADLKQSARRQHSL
jgi:hypothetical protein